MMVVDGESEGEWDRDEGKEITQKRVRSFVGPYGHIGYGEDKETQLRITLRWRLMGGNKKGHRVATAVRKGGQGECPSIRASRERAATPLRAAPTRFSSQNGQTRCASSVLGDLRFASGPRRAGDQGSAVASAGISMDVTLV